MTKADLIDDVAGAVALAHRDVQRHEIDASAERCLRRLRGRLGVNDSESRDDRCRDEEPLSAPAPRH